MADLSPLDEKLAEVLGLAQASQDATTKVAGMEDAEDFAAVLERMGKEAAETERRTDAHIDTLEGRKTAIREMAAETKAEVKKMMQTYLADEVEALDGFEFLTMAEAAELGHWEIVKVMSDTLGDSAAGALADHAVAVERTHVAAVRESSLKLAADEVRTTRHRRGAAGAS